MARDEAIVSDVEEECDAVEECEAGSESDVEGRKVEG